MERRLAAILVADVVGYSRLLAAAGFANDDFVVQKFAAIGAIHRSTPLTLGATIHH